MTPPRVLTRATEDELVTAVSSNLYALFRAMQRLPGSEVVEGDKLSYHHVALTNPFFRGVWRTRLAPAEIDSAIDETITWFALRGAPDFFCWTDPQTQPANLAERLLRRGFDGNLVGDPGMVADLHALIEDSRPPDGFTIVPAITQEALLDWRDVFTAAFEMPTAGGQAWVEATLQAGWENTPWQLPVGYLEGKPVASSMIFKGAGVAGLYSVGVLPEARRQGLGTAITLRPLLEARQKGYHYAVLFSSRMAYSAYQRLGFREIAGKIGIYIFEKD
jgi:ribosomal protein S18 acetylase RimI-like enzyme